LLKLNSRQLKEAETYLKEKTIEERINSKTIQLKNKKIGTTGLTDA